jgi:formylglycine-generating enzyme required for sulfatase activity
MPPVSAKDDAPGQLLGLSPFRIFLASPGDVRYERQLAREAVEQVRGERRFRGRLTIEVIAWDQAGQAVAMEAGRTPQDSITRGLPKPEECDLAVVIFWSRIGTRLPADYERKPDGKPYLSGTEWEFCNALEGFRRKGAPDVWVYRRTEVPKLAANDPELTDRIAQWNKVNSLLDGLHNLDGSIAGGVNKYDTPDAFRRLFEQHLRDRLDQLLEQLPEPEPTSPAGQSVAEAAPEARWAGVPYPGLDAFTADQAPIFFGRGPEVDQLIRILADPQVRFLAVVGVSGSGKSSLVAAGLIPRLRAGFPGGAPWRDLVFKPGERGQRDGGPFLALAYALKGTLGALGRPERELAADLRSSPALLAELVARLLEGGASAAELALVVDQFEELFTQTDPSDRKPFLDLLAAAAALPRLRVIVTLRADFYAQAVAEPVLAALLRRDRGTFPLDPPGPGALLEMIEGPAQAAGLELEAGLADQILEDAGTAPGALALTAFALHALYQEAGGSGRLTRDAYRAIGGVAGAVRRRAEEVLGRLEGQQDKPLEALFAHLVEVNEQEVATRRRAAKPLAVADAGAVVDALAEARLLVGGKGADDTPTVEVAHEAVLTAWPRLADWIRQNAEAVRARRDLERAAAEWRDAEGAGSALRTGAALKRYRSAAPPRSALAARFLAACVRRARLRWAGAAAASALAAFALWVLVAINDSKYPQALAAEGLAVRFGLWPVPTPEMRRIPGGTFEMGDHHNVQKEAGPVHRVKIAPFAIGVHEVTFAEYDLFAAATGRDVPNAQGWGRADRPVINVRWQDAVDYAAWLSQRTEKTYRLPTEAEWEYAARGGKEGEPFYWGDEVSQACDYANVQDQTLDRAETSYESGLKAAQFWAPASCPDDYVYTAPVKSKKPNGYNLYDMAGNVFEWVQDCYQEGYEGAPADGSARQPEDPTKCQARVVRGGSWNFEPDLARSAVRLRDTPGNANNNPGFSPRQIPLAVFSALFPFSSAAPLAGRRRASTR